QTGNGGTLQARRQRQTPKRRYLGYIFSSLLGRLGRYRVRRLPLRCPRPQPPRALASGSQRVQRHSQPSAARVQFWPVAPPGELQLGRAFSFTASTVEDHPDCYSAVTILTMALLQRFS